MKTGSLLLTHLAGEALDQLEAARALASSLTRGIQVDFAHDGQELSI